MATTTKKKTSTKASTSRTTQTKRPRRTRTAGRRDILTFEVPDGMVGRWVNDNKAGRNIQHMLDLGWSFLSDDGLPVGDEDVESNRQAGTLLSRQVGADGVIAYAMVIDKDLYEQDQEAKQEQIDETERAMREELREQGRYGHLDSKVTY